MDYQLSLTNPNHLLKVYRRMKVEAPVLGNEKEQSVWPVMVLAHNEEKFIGACLDSLYEAEPGRELAIFVMANGCTDKTESVVQSYADEHEGVTLVSLSMPDKNNAWNVFVHEVIPKRFPESEIYFFMDGDARATSGALSELATGLVNHPRAHAASALPASGRSMQKDRGLMLRDHGLVANLYALRGSFIEDLLAKTVKLPLKLEGDDGLLGALVKWDLDPTDSWNDDRIVPCPNAGFVFESASWTKPSDWTTYWRRAVRYGRRHYEFELLGKTLKTHGITALPADITELYHLSSTLKLRWNGLYTIPNWFALREMRKYCKD